MQILIGRLLYRSLYNFDIFSLLLLLLFISVHFESVNTYEYRFFSTVSITVWLFERPLFKCCMVIFCFFCCSPSYYRHAHIYRHLLIIRLIIDRSPYTTTEHPVYYRSTTTPIIIVIYCTGRRRTCLAKRISRIFADVSFRGPRHRHRPAAFTDD